MASPRQLKLSATLRIVAGACAVLWFVGPLLCGAGRISKCEGHHKVCAGQAAPTHAHDIAPAHEHEQSHDAAQAHHHDDGEAQHEHGSKDKKSCDEKICCSSMQAIVPTAKPILIANSLSQQLFVVCLLNAAGENVLAASNCEPIRQAPPPDWVFTPELCLGPAHRSLAPPSSAVG